MFTDSTTEFFAIFKKVFAENGLEKLATDDNIAKFYELNSLLVKANSETNLTAINDTRDIIVKHYADSLFACDMLEENSSLIDIGCGAGFPSLPLAIVRPDIKITALDSTGKKIDFVKKTAKALGLDNVQAVCARAEEFVNNDIRRESFDYATARAVSRLNVLAELALPFVKIGGTFIALKAKDGESELAEALGGIEVLGGQVESTKALTLTDTDGFSAQRVIVNIKKVSQTPPKYPRAYAKITKKPL